MVETVITILKVLVYHIFCPIPLELHFTCSYRILFCIRFCYGSFGLIQ